MSNTNYNYGANAFLINALTPMHPGRGGENYDVIDRLVQRDPTTNLPTIYGSSLKGALREFISHYNKTTLNINEIFGGDPRGKQGEESAGKFLFLGAQLLSLPVRTNKLLFVRVTCPYVLNSFAELLNTFGLNSVLAGECTKLANAQNIGKYFFANTGEIKLEEHSIKVNHGGNALSDAIAKVFGSELAVVSDEDMRNLAGDYCLPVIARNYLEDGQSKNLWYEQVLPRETRMAFTVLYPNAEEELKQYMKGLRAAITENPVHIGANASVGYGFCNITSIND